MIQSNTCGNRGCGSIQKWNIGNTVRAILMADEDVHNKVGNNIYPLVASEDVKGDFIVYKRDRYTKSKTKMGVHEDNVEVYVTAVSDNYDSAIELAALIDNALIGEHILEDGGKITIDLADSTEDFDDNKYIETILLNIK